jgi:hypothetical protein
VTSTDEAKPPERILEAGRRVYAALQAEKALPHLKSGGETGAEAFIHAAGMAAALANGIAGPEITAEQLATVFEQAADNAEEALAQLTALAERARDQPGQISTLAQSS